MSESPRPQLTRGLLNLILGSLGRARIDVKVVPLAPEAKIRKQMSERIFRWIARTSHGGTPMRACSGKTSFYLRCADYSTKLRLQRLQNAHNRKHAPQLVAAAGVVKPSFE